MSEAVIRSVGPVDKSVLLNGKLKEEFAKTNLRTFSLTSSSIIHEWSNISFIVRRFLPFSHRLATYTVDQGKPVFAHFSPAFLHIISAYTGKHVSNFQILFTRYAIFCKIYLFLYCLRME